MHDKANKHEVTKSFSELSSTMETKVSHEQTFRYLEQCVQKTELKVTF